MSGVISQALGMPLRDVLDPQFFIKEQRLMHEIRPKEVKLIKPFKPLSKRHKELQKTPNIFKYSIGRIEVSEYLVDAGYRQTDQLDVIRAVDPETQVKIEFEPGDNAVVHVLLIAYVNHLKPTGAFKVIKTMSRFKDVHIEAKGRNFAYGRSLASTEPVKLNKARWKATNGDWRRVKANIKDRYGNRSQHMDRLFGFYMRSGLWVPVDWSNWETEGIEIAMPSDKCRLKFKEELGDDYHEFCKYGKRHK